MQKGQTVMQAARKLATNYIRYNINNAIGPISEEIKQYITRTVEESIPEVVLTILGNILESEEEGYSDSIEINEIVKIVLDFTKIIPKLDGIEIVIDMEQVQEEMRLITSAEIVHEYFSHLEFNVVEMQNIVVRNLKAHS